MNKKEAVDIVNELVKISVTNKNFVHGSEPYRSFGVGNMNISFIGYDAVLSYQEGLDKLYKFDNQIEQTISIKRFEDYIVHLIRSLRNTGKKCTFTDIQDIIEELLNLEYKEYEILYELYGSEMQGSTMTLGSFTVYNFNLAENILFEKYPPLALYQDIYFEDRNSDTFIGVKVFARENNRAVEIADDLVETFENVMNYMITDLNHERNVGNFNFTGWKSTNRIICSRSGMGSHSSRDILKPVNIEDPFFNDISQGNDKVWLLITKSNKTEIETRLLQAIEWIGKGVHDKDKSKALVQFVFAIEGMLQYDKQSLISPSIVSQLSEWLAFIIQDDPIKRKEIANYFKQTYKKRSAIVHGGAKTIDIDDLQIALKIAKLMVISFLTIKPFCNFKTMQELGEYITELKFK